MCGYSVKYSLQNSGLLLKVFYTVSCVYEFVVPYSVYREYPFRERSYSEYRD